MSAPWPTWFTSKPTVRHVIVLVLLLLWLPFCWCNSVAMALWGSWVFFASKAMYLA